MLAPADSMRCLGPWRATLAGMVFIGLRQSKTRITSPKTAWDANASLKSVVYQLQPTKLSQLHGLLLVWVWT